MTNTCQLLAAVQANERLRTEAEAILAASRTSPRRWAGTAWAVVYLIVVVCSVVAGIRTYDRTRTAEFQRDRALDVLAPILDCARAGGAAVVWKRPEGESGPPYLGKCVPPDEAEAAL